MGRLLDGKWVTQDLGADAQGRYVRRATQFRSKPESPAEPGRYRLIVGLACGWSHRVLLVRAVLGMEESLPISITDAFMGQDGWTFHDHPITGDMLGLEQVEPIKAMHEIYTLAQSDYSGRASVPVLWDTRTGTIVNNESSDLIRILSSPVCKSMATLKGVNLMPAECIDEINSMIDANYGPINNGVYRCGFASSQEAYNEAAIALFQRFDELEELLSKQRFLVRSNNDNDSSADHLTLADLCLFPTLYRFDHVYHTHFKCNRKHLYEYENLWAWTRDVYQHPGVKETCDMEQIRQHYYRSHESISPRRIVPLGPSCVDFDASHGRGEKNYIRK